MLRHQLGGALDRALHTGGADEHVVGLFLEHELTGPCQRVEGRLLQRAELILAVPVGEVGEHEELQPVRGLLVEGAEDAGRIKVSRVSFQQLLGFFAALAAEVGVQQVHHRPEVPSLFDVDLEQISQVVQAGCGVAEDALLLDGCRLGVTLHGDQAHQLGAVLPRHFLPRRLALVLSERDRAFGVAFCQEDAPPVLLHGDVVEVCPAVASDRDRGAQVDILGRQGRPEGLPPVQELGLPPFECALQPPVFREVDVVGNSIAVVDLAHRSGWRRRGSGAFLLNGHGGLSSG